ncbi:hypothetical protein QYM36_016153, partial [Artemia franciscana]
DSEAISETADDTDEVFLYTIQNNTREDEAFAELSIEGQMCIKFKIDTGAQVNVLPLQYYTKLPIKPGLIKGNHKLTSYCGSAIPYAGISLLTCRYKDGKTQSHAFYIVRSNTTPIVGLKSCKDLELIKLILNIQKEDRTTSAYSKLDTFEGIENLENKCEIHLKENAVPTVYPARKVPLAMKQKLKDELDRLEALNIIGKVSEPTDWVNAMVMVEKKDGSVRLCIDPVDLNKTIRRPHYPIPTFEDATEDLHGISTHRIFEGLEGIRILIDDILVYGKSQEAHDNRLRAVLKRAREKGVRFNRGKCTFGIEQVKYFDHIISKEGIKPDPEKLIAIKKMPSPTTKEELQTLLDMLNFLFQYIPSLSSRNKILRDLIIEVEFEWGPHHEECFSAIKQSITDNLAFFDHSSHRVDLKVDASKHGLGAEISTNGNIFGYASRALSKTEQNYSQLEKEMYAIVYGLKHFHHYIYGRKIASGLLDYEAVSDRIVMACLKGQSNNLTKLSVYAPIRDAPDHLKDKFYADLQLTLNKIPRKDILVIGGDFNARIGTRLNDSEWAIGSQGLGNYRINGVRLIILRQILEHRLIHQQETIQVFIDFVTAFDLVKRIAIWDAMRDDGVPKKIVCLIKAYYVGTRAFIRADGEISKEISIDKGVQQGCALNFVIDQIMKTLDKYKGVTISPALSITDLDYANDVDILAESIIESQLMIGDIAARSLATGLKISQSKTKSMRNSGLDETRITLNGIPIEDVQNFKYLGSLINPKGEALNKIQSRISAAWAAFIQLRKCLCQQPFPSTHQQAKKKSDGSSTTDPKEIADCMNASFCTNFTSKPPVITLPTIPPVTVHNPMPLTRVSTISRRNVPKVAGYEEIVRERMLDYDLKLILDFIEVLSIFS